jgi:hypothetical protein
VPREKVNGTGASPRPRVQFVRESCEGDTGHDLPTRKNFEGPLCALLDNLGPSAESGRDTFMGEAGTEDINQFVDWFLDDGWEGFVDLKRPERV